jgi:hypothetical protein
MIVRDRIRKACKMTKSAFQFETKVGPGGKLEIKVPLPLGTTVEVLVLAPEADEFTHLVEAAATSTGFWDNPLDDEDWNNV